MKLFGFKPSRFEEWMDVMAEERKSATLLDLVWEMIVALWRGHLVSRSQWRQRMRRCRKCPIYDRRLKRCRPYTGSKLGCGCAMFFAAMFKKHGWATENLEPAVAREICW